MNDAVNLQEYRKEAPAPVEQPVFDPDAGWIEMRRYGDGEHHVAWCVRIKIKVPGAYSRNNYTEDSEKDLCVIKVPIHSKKFDRLNKRARFRALTILRAWRGDQQQENDE